MRFAPVAAAALVATAMPAIAQPADDNAAIRAAADAFIDAQRRGDAAALDRLLAPDFLFVRGSGRVGDRRDFLAGFGPATRVEEYNVTDRLFSRVSPDVAILGGEARVRGTDGPRTFTQRQRFSHVLARRAGKWVIVYLQVAALAN